jgi:site-specific DNA-methyltransferase (adenine-specific)
MVNVLHGNNIELLKSYPNNYFDAVVTDPPYGLGKEPNANEMLQAWITEGYLEVKGAGFMGKKWDAFVPQPIFWKEVFRVLKHGGHVVSFFGTRTYDWGVMAMRLAGFEVRDCIQWVYGSGFPKSHNIGKAIDKLEGAERELVEVKGKVFIGSNNNINGISGIYKQKSNKPATDQAKQWEGWGSALKPANEPIVLARKPLEKGLSIAENVLKWGTGGINIDGTRIKTNDTWQNQAQDIRGYNGLMSKNERHPNLIQQSHSEGRFPANLILTHHPECECIGVKKVGSGKEGGYNYEGNVYNVEGFVPNNSPTANSNYGEETIEDWNCHEDCPIKIMDEQSGVLKSGKMLPTHKKTTDISPNGIYGKFSIDYVLNETYGDKGGASRFFYCAKASKSERNYGLGDFESKRASAYGYDLGEGNAGEGMFKDRNPIKQNFHPTIKPVDLMRYLCKLITPPNGIILDPFCGSGTTGIGAKMEGFNFVGLEQDADYCKIANARIEAWQPNQAKPKSNKKVIDPIGKPTEVENTTPPQLTLF